MSKTTKYDVFISYKNSDAEGNKTKDSIVAAKLYSYLTDKGLHVFFSEKELERHGNAKFSEVIDDALDASRFLIVIGCHEEHFDAQWVKYEWNGFLNDIRSGIKPDGQVFVLYQGIKTNDLPRALRQQQAFDADDENSYQSLFGYINSNIKGKNGEVLNGSQK